MGDEKVHDFKSLGHKTLAQIAKEGLESPSEVERRIDKEAQVQRKPQADPHSKNGKKNPTQVPEERELGRIRVFKPTKERVTVVRERVGKAYNGVWIHGVVNRAGDEFLASETQLGDLV